MIGQNLPHSPEVQIKEEEHEKKFLSYPYGVDNLAIPLVTVGLELEFLEHPFQGHCTRAFGGHLMEPRQK